MRPASLADVARAAGYSVGTASRVLSGKARAGRISANAVAAIEGAAARLAYAPNAVARALRTRSTRMIGLVVSDIANSFFGRIAAFAEKAAPGFAIAVANSGEDPARERACLAALAARRVDGVLLSPVGADPAAALELERQGIAVVTFDRELPGRRFDAVVCDNRATAARLTARLAGRRPAFVGGSRASSTHAERLAGFRDVAEGPAFFDVEPERIARRTRDRDAILFANALLAEGVIAWLLRNEPARLPTLKLAAFDESPLFLALPVLVARQPEEEMARRAVALLKSRIDGRGGKRRRVVLRQRLLGA
jgi:LacI family transcriptional regulator